MRTRMVLHEKGINFQVHEVDLSNKSEEFLSVSPYGKVPVLRVNGSSLYESNIVNEYLDEVYDSPGLSRRIPNREHRHAPGWPLQMTTSSHLSTGFAWLRKEGIPKSRFKKQTRSSTMHYRAWST